MFDSVLTKVKQAKVENFPGATLSFQKGALSTNFMTVHAWLGATKEEMPNGIVQNDPLRVNFFIESLGNGQFRVEPTLSVGRLKPTNKFYAMDSEKIRTRKFTGDEDRVAANIGKMLAKVRQRVAELDAEDRFLDGLAYSIADKIA